MADTIMNNLTMLSKHGIHTGTITVDGDNVFYRYGGHDVALTGMHTVAYNGHLLLETYDFHEVVHFLKDVTS